MPAGVGYEPTPCRIASQAFTAPRAEIARPLSHGGRYGMFCDGLLKTAPFHSGFHPYYPIIAIAAMPNDASAVTNSDCDCSAGINGD